MENTNTILVLLALVVILSGAFYFVFLKDGALGSTTGGVNNSALTYSNTEYGFTFALPETWKGYSVVPERWSGSIIKVGTASESGPRLLIRNPKWTAIKHYEDIPVLVFTIKQWDSYLAENFAVSAAPILATELARNNKFVFALPPRWNYDYSEGHVEAESIVNSNPLKGFNIK